MTRLYLYGNTTQQIVLKVPISQTQEHSKSVTLDYAYSISNLVSRIDFNKTFDFGFYFCQGWRHFWVICLLKALQNSSALTYGFNTCNEDNWLWRWLTFRFSIDFQRSLKIWENNLNLSLKNRYHDNRHSNPRQTNNRHDKP